MAVPARRMGSTNLVQTLYASFETMTHMLWVDRAHPFN